MLRPVASDNFRSATGSRLDPLLVTSTAVLPPLFLNSKASFIAKFKSERT